MLTSGEGNNYDSLTSDDPNYETVRHLKTLENPYEMLENELGTPAALEVVGTQVVQVEVNNLQPLENENCFETEGKGDKRKVSPSDSPEVGDYFQV